jgi:hypothetical protein
MDRRKPTTEQGAPRSTDTRDTQPVPEVPETGGRGGTEPTRYGDWEVNGICTDF